MLKRITSTVLLLGIVATTSPASAQATCGPRDQFVTKLENTYGESRTGAGLNGTTAIFEIWASADSGSWTILVTDPKGISCVMATGENWHYIQVIPSKQDVPA